MPDAEPSKPLRILIPVRQHLQLQKFKLLRGQTQSETIESALDLYFSKATNRLTEL